MASFSFIILWLGFPTENIDLRKRRPPFQLFPTVVGFALLKERLSESRKNIASPLSCRKFTKSRETVELKKLVIKATNIMTYSAWIDFLYNLSIEISYLKISTWVRSL